MYGDLASNSLFKMLEIGYIDFLLILFFIFMDRYVAQTMVFAICRFSDTRL